jgi:hypothetical protein
MQGFEKSSYLYLLLSFIYKAELYAMGVYQNGKIPGFFRFKSPLGNFQTPENQYIVSIPSRWLDKIEGLLIHPP